MLLLLTAASRLRVPQVMAPTAWRSLQDKGIRVLHYSPIKPWLDLNAQDAKYGEENKVWVDFMVSALTRLRLHQEPPVLELLAFLRTAAGNRVGTGHRRGRVRRHNKQ